MKKLYIWITVIIIVVGIQFIPQDRTNPPNQGEINLAPEAMSCLQRCCYDCHSNQTKWLWYSRIVPVSYLIIRDVKEAREHVNFTVWDTYSFDDQRKLIKECWEEIEEGEMPLKKYLLLHPNAKLTDADLVLMEKHLQHD